MARNVAAPVPEDRHAPRSALPPAVRAAASRIRFDADEIERFCAGCTPELGEAGWTHERSCPFRRRTA